MPENTPTGLGQSASVPANTATAPATPGLEGQGLPPPGAQTGQGQAGQPPSERILGQADLDAFVSLPSGEKVPLKEIIERGVFRDADYRRKTMSHAENVRAFEAEKAEALTQLRNTYQQIEEYRQNVMSMPSPQQGQQPQNSQVLYDENGTPYVMPPPSQSPQNNAQMQALFNKVNQLEQGIQQSGSRAEQATRAAMQAQDMINLQMEKTQALSQFPDVTWDMLKKEATLRSANNEGNFQTLPEIAAELSRDLKEQRANWEASYTAKMRADAEAARRARGLNSGGAGMALGQGAANGKPLTDLSNDEMFALLVEQNRLLESGNNI